MARPSNPLLDAAMAQPRRANPLLDAVMSQSPAPAPDLQGTRWDIALQMLQSMPGPIPMEESFLETVHTTAGRGVFQAMRQMAGLRQTGAGVVESVIGENFFSDILAEKGKQEQFTAEVGLKFLPRDKESEGTIEGLVGNVLESGPSTALPIAVGILASPIAGPAAPLITFAMFAGTAAAPVVGGQYLEALAAGRTEGEAEVEALVAGAVTFTSQLLPFQFLFRKIPGASRFLDTGARRWAFRTVGGGAGEGGQEIVEGVGIQTAEAILRDDPELAFEMLTWDFWGPLMEEVVTAAIVGSSFGGSIAFKEEFQAKRDERKQLRMEDLRIAQQSILLTVPDAAPAPGQVSTSLDLVGEPAKAGLPDKITPVVFHGTSTVGLARGDLDPARAVETAGAIFFSDNEDISSQFTQPREFGEIVSEQDTGEVDPDTGEQIFEDIEAGPIIPARLRIENPLILEGKEAQDVIDDSTKQGQVVRQAKEDGHDGIILRDVAEFADPLARGDVFAVFDKSQILPPEAAAEPALDVEPKLASIDDLLLGDAEAEAQLIRSGPLGDDARRNADAVLGEVQRRLDDQAAAPEPTPAPVEPPKPKQRESTRDLVRRIVWGGPYRVETVTEAEALLQEIRELKKLGREAIRKARAEGVEDATRVWEDRLERAKNRAGEVEALKQELLDGITERLGGKIPSNLAKRIARVRTRKQLDNAIAVTERLVHRLERTEAIDRVKTAVRGAKKGPVAPDIQEAIDELLSDLNIVNLSDALRDVLTDIRAALRATTDQTQIPKRLEEQLGRLDKTDVKELETSDIQHLAVALEGLLGKNRARHKARANARAQTEERAAEVVSSEIAGRSRPGPGAVVPTESRGASLRPLRIDRQGRQEIDDPNRLQRFGSIAFGRIPNLLLPTLAEYLGGRASGTYQILYADVDRGMDKAYDLEFQFIDMWEEALRKEGVGERKLRRMSARIATASNIVARAVQSLGGTPFSATSADIITYKLSNNQTMKLDRDERMYLLNLLRRRIAFEDIVHRGTTIKLRANPSKSIKLTAADVRIIRETMPGVNEVTTDNAVADAMFDIVNGPARQAMSQWSIDTQGWDLTAGEAFYWMSRREHTQAPPKLTGSSFTRRTLHGLSILKPKTKGAENAYLIGSMVGEGRRYFKQVAMLTQAGPQLDLAAKTINNETVAAVLRSLKGGKQIIDRFNRTYEQMATDAGVGTPVDGPAETFVGKLINSAQIGALGLNAWVSLYQPLSLVMAGMFQNPAYLVQAASTGAFADLRINRRMKQHGFMRRRNFGSNLGLASEGGTLGTQMLGKRDGLREKFMGAIRLMDMAAVRTIWRAAEIEAGAEIQADGLLSDADLEAVAEIAVRTVKMSQPTFDSLHLSYTALEGKQSPTTKLAFGMFRAQVSKNMNMYHQFAMRGEWGKLAVSMVIPSILLALIRDIRDTFARGKKPDKPFHMRILRGSGAALLGQPVFGDWIVLAADIAAGERGYEPSNVATGMAMDMFSSISRARAAWIKQGLDSDKTQRALVEVAVAAATVWGIPARSLWKDLSPWFWPKPPEGKKRKGF